MLRELIPESLDCVVDDIYFLTVFKWKNEKQYIIKCLNCIKV